MDITDQQPQQLTSQPIQPPVKQAIAGKSSFPKILFSILLSFVLVGILSGTYLLMKYNNVKKTELPIIVNTSPTLPKSTPISEIEQQSSLTEKCMPHGFTLSSPFTYKGGSTKVDMTIGDELKNIGAYCSSSNLLVDKNGKQISIYRKTTCWGNAPAYNTKLQTTDTEGQKIHDLQQHYTVLIIPCPTYID